MQRRKIPHGRDFAHKRYVVWWYSSDAMYSITDLRPATNGHIYALDHSTGSCKWDAKPSSQHGLLKGDLMSIAFLEGKLYSGGSATVICFDASSGAIVSSLTFQTESIYSFGKSLWVQLSTRPTMLQSMPSKVGYLLVGEDMLLALTQILGMSAGKMICQKRGAIT
jgi:hypothetical protein